MLVVVACSDVKQDSGLDAELQVRSAQFRRGVMPGDGAGPAVVQASLTHLVTPGVLTDNNAAGELASSANAIAVQLDGDVGWWSLPAGVPSLVDPQFPTFSFQFGLAADTPAVQRNVILRAVDASGRFGPAQIRDIVVGGPATPTGRFVIALRWDSQADLNLHVVLPNGVEIWNRNPAEYIPPPVTAGPIDKLAQHDGGVLDRDSNARCIADGQREEDVVWSDFPPSGHYLVRVDTFSLCGSPGATWRVDAVLDGKTLAGATGTSTDNDLRFDHGRGGGVLAVELDIP
jgi:hypothetical protein